MCRYAEAQPSVQTQSPFLQACCRLIPILFSFFPSFFKGIFWKYRDLLWFYFIPSLKVLFQWIPSNSISLPSLARNLVSMNDMQLWLVAESFTPTEMSDSMPVTSSEDWTAAFGLKNEDDLGVWCLFFFFLTLKIDTEALPVLVHVRLAICSQNVCRCKSLDCFLFLMSIHVFELWL